MRTVGSATRTGRAARSFVSGGRRGRVLQARCHPALRMAASRMDALARFVVLVPIGGGEPAPAGLSAAPPLLLDGRTFHRPERTEDATVPLLGPQHGTTAFALVEEQARVRRHGFPPGETTVRAGQYRLKNDVAHGCLTPSTWRGVLAKILGVFIVPSPEAQCGCADTQRANATSLAPDLPGRQGESGGDADHHQDRTQVRPLLGE